MSQLTVTTILSANGTDDLVIKTGNTTTGATVTLGANGVLTINTTSTLNFGNSQTYGNSTSNATVNTSIIQIANTTSQANLTPTSFTLGGNVSLMSNGATFGNVTMNTISLSVGSNVVFSTANISIGNSTVNATLTTTGVLVNGAAMSSGATLVANTTDTQTYYLPMTNASSGTWANAVVAPSKISYNPSTKSLKIGNSSVYTQITNLGIVTNFFILDTCGYNGYGQLGNGTTTNSSSPGTTIGGGTTWSQVACGQRHTAAIKTNGTLWTWGWNNNGQLGDGTTTSRSSPGTVAGGGTTWAQVSCGSAHTAAIKTDGTLWTWGYDSYGQLGDGTTTSRSSPGTTIGGGTTWSQVAGGFHHTAAIKTDGTLWTWGYNVNGQLGDSTTTNRSSPGTTAGGGTTWAQVAGGEYHTAAIKTDGTLWTWGSDSYGQLGDGTTTSRSSPGTTIGGGTTWSQVACGYYHTVALKTDGTLWTWGKNNLGQLGDGTTTSRSSPGTTAGGGTTWSKISSRYYQTAAIKTDGTLWGCGYNTGDLGDNTLTTRSSFVTPAGGGTTWKQVACGQNHTAAIQQTSQQL